MRFTSQTTVKAKNGGVAYAISAKQELIKMCLTSFLSADYYETDKVKLARLQELAKKVDPEFCLRLAIFSRAYGLRSVNHVLFVEAIKWMSWKKGIRSTLLNVLIQMVRRPDELLDIVGYYAHRNGMNMNSIILPNALKTAVSKRLSQFTDYQIAKYKWKGDAINLYDLVNMTHAKSDTITKLMEGKLEPADTWEAVLSQNGNTQESWDKLIDGKKLGALATIRNLRNMVQAGVDSTKIAEYLDQIKWSDVFPFQAIQALDMVYQIHGLDDEISKVVMKHVKECFKFIAEKYPGKVAIGVDISGSMFGSSVSKLSSFDRAQMAIAYGTILKELTWGDLFFWSDRCYKIVPKAEIDFKEVRNEAFKMRWGTHVSCFTDAIHADGYDYVLILTDEGIDDSLKQVAKKQTIVWGLHDMENTIASGNGVTYFTGYNDIMWKVGGDMFRLGEIEKEIRTIEI